MKTNLLKNPMTRRTFLVTSAMTAFTAAIAMSPAATRTAQATTTKQASTDLDILNYALTLEHLENYAYRLAIGSGLLSGAALKYFQQNGAHEATHVDTLTKTITSLGGTPVKEQASYTFPAFASQKEVLTYFQVVEELGAAAYLGQAPRIQNPDLLTAAVSIHNVEAQHAAVLSDLIGVSPSPVFGAPKTMEQVLAVVTPILSGAMPALPNTGLGGSAIKARPAAHTRKPVRK
jgi:Ferritin-like domain